MDARSFTGRFATGDSAVQICHCSQIGNRRESRKVQSTAAIRIGGLLEVLAEKCLEERPEEAKRKSEEGKWKATEKQLERHWKSN